MARLVLLDFDGTLLTQDSGVICALPSFRSGLLTPKKTARLAATFALYKAGLRTRRDAQLAGFACYAGATLDELRASMAELHRRHMRAYVSRPMRRIVDQHLAAGDQVHILTASAFFFAEPLAAEWGLAGVIGTQVEFDARGRCTGRVSGPILDGFAKRDAGAAAAAAAGTHLGATSFYTDHHADLPLLEAVGDPVAVGPTAPLEREAQRRGWRIVYHDRRASPWR